MNKKKIIKLGIVGLAGKMGQAITRLALQDPRISVKAGKESPNHKLLGKDIGEMLADKPSDIFITDNHKVFYQDIDIVIEFGLEKATIENLNQANKYKVAFVSGSTGLSYSTIDLMKKLSKKIPVFWAPNMSIGANLLKKLSQELAYKLGSNFDIDITDLHHKNKKDLPSGTALSIKEGITEVLKKKKIKKNINISAIRAGDSTGEHSVIFSGIGEKVILKHISTSRDIFAYGAIEISKWLHNKKPGFYDMNDFLTVKS